MKFKKGDTVTVVKGKDKGKTEKIEKVYPKENLVQVLGVNQYKRHLKARSQNEKSEVRTITKPLPVSNIALVCPNCKKLTRVGFTTEGKEKLRICKRCKKTI